MLRSTILTVEHIAPSLDATIGRGRAPGAEAEQRLKGRHGLVTSIVPKDEFVQVHLQLCAADAVIGADQPVLEVPDGAVRKGHDGGRTFAKGWTPRLRARDVPEAGSVQPGESRKPVGVNRRAWSDVLLENGGHRRRREVWQDHHTDPTRTIPAPLDRDQDGDRATVLQLSTPFEPRLRTTNPGVIDFNFPVEGLARHIDHRSAQLVEHHPRGFIAAQAELALEQERGDAALVRRHQVCGPKPLRQRRLRVVQNRSGGQGHLMATRRALPPSIRQPVRTGMSAARARETLRPAARRQVLLAGLVRPELTLKLAQILREGRARHARTL